MHADPAGATARDAVLMAHTPAGPQRLERRGTAPIVLERWRLELGVSDVPRHDRLPAVYKQAIVHFRALYALARLLPTAAACARTRREGSVRISVVVGESNTPLATTSRHWRMPSICTPVGTLQCSVEYADLRDMHLQQGRPSVPTSAPALRPSSSLGSRGAALTGSSPLWSKMLSEAPRGAAGRPARPAATDRALRSQISSWGAPRMTPSSFGAPRPSLGAGPSSLGVGTPSLGSTSSVGAGPPSLSVAPSSLTTTPWTRAQHVPGAPLGRSPLDWDRDVPSKSYEPGALRGLFASTPRTHYSPSSLSSLRTPPHGTFETHMRRRDAGRADESPQDDTSTAARPQRIPRYERQPSYRQREISRSMGGSVGSHDDGASAPRSWSRRSELRRQLERASPGDMLPSSATSPSQSRVFPTPGPAPAFAMPRIASAGQRHGTPATTPPTTPGDALDLVAMIDTSKSGPPAPAPPPPPPPPREMTSLRPRGPGTSSDSYYDDMLSKLAASLHLPALDDVLPPAKTDGTESGEEEAAGRLELA